MIELLMSVLWLSIAVALGVIGIGCLRVVWGWRDYRDMIFASVLMTMLFVISMIGALLLFMLALFANFS